MDNKSVNLENSYQDIIKDLKEMEGQMSPYYKQKISESCLPVVQQLFDDTYDKFEEYKQMFLHSVDLNQATEYNNKTLQRELFTITKQLTTEMTHLRCQQMVLQLTETNNKLLKMVDELIDRLHPDAGSKLIAVDSDN